MIVSALMDLVVTVTRFLRLWVAPLFCEKQEVQPRLTDKIIVEGQKWEMDNLRQSYMQEKNYSIVEMWECEWKQNLRENHEIKSFVRSAFPFKRPLKFALS